MTKSVYGVEQGALHRHMSLAHTLCS